MRRHERWPPNEIPIVVHRSQFPNGSSRVRTKLLPPLNSRAVRQMLKPSLRLIRHVRGLSLQVLARGLYLHLVPRDRERRDLP